VVLGAGATAVSAAAALSDLGLQRLHLAVRDESRAATARDAVSSWGVQVSVGNLHNLDAVVADLLVSTVPASAAAGSTALLQDVGTVFDVVYDPWPTPLSRAAAELGSQLLDGLDLLAHQAALQVLAMTGLGVDVEVLRQAARSELAQRRG
jgi:shikimate dehydrogenase